MIVVIIAGGSGTRLWPLSTPDYPKHLLKIDGNELSLLQQTYERARQLADKIYVASEASHIDKVKAQLPDLPDEAFMVEPARRGTSNCILAALALIVKTNADDVPVVFMHADHYIRDTKGFTHSVKLAAKASQKHQRMVLIGIEPHYAATVFGYIKKGELIDDASFVFKVDGFKEKPDRETALAYLNSGNYLWNAGYFVGSIKVFKKAMKKAAPRLLEIYDNLCRTTEQAYADYYLSLENIAIDYTLIEKVQDLLVIPASFDWMDLGSYNDLHKAIGGDEKGNYIAGRVEIESVQNSFIHNQEEKPVAVIGLDNVAIVNTPHGLLVTRKDLAPKVGDVSKRLNNS
jgi:mannose-1-phosphate guanylyltransferase/mannose-6-phosphate isomerase